MYSCILHLLEKIHATRILISASSATKVTRSSTADNFLVQCYVVPSSETFFAGPDTKTTSLDQTPRRLTLTCPSSTHINDLQRSKSYTSRSRAPEDYKRPLLLLSSSASAFEHRAGHSPRSDIYTSRLQFEPHKQSRSPSPSLLAGSASKSI